MMRGRGGSSIGLRFSVGRIKCGLSLFSGYNLLGDTSYLTEAFPSWYALGWWLGCLPRRSVGGMRMPCGNEQNVGDSSQCCLPRIRRIQSRWIGFPSMDHCHNSTLYHHHKCNIWRVYHAVDRQRQHSSGVRCHCSWHLAFSVMTVLLRLLSTVSSLPTSQIVLETR